MIEHNMNFYDKMLPPGVTFPFRSMQGLCLRGFLTLILRLGELELIAE